MRHHTQPRAGRPRSRFRGRLLLAALACGLRTAVAADPLKELSLEALMNVEVYSASRHLETTQSTPSAIFVITNEDLRRSGATSVPEALRLVPGVDVGRVDANKWAVGIRGFNSREANKLLVLVDGRSIYDPLFSGTLWEAQDFLIEDIDRIEVIRGPGGSLWGANAFNGVINIVTRRASDTQGVLLSGLAGTEDRYIATARFGWQPADGQHARVYVKGFERDTGYSPTDAPHDGSNARRGGFRWDWDGSATDSVSLSGDVFRTDAGIRETRTQVQDVLHRGRSLVVAWNHAFENDQALQVQAFHDHVDYESLGYDQRRDTFDLEAQHRLDLGTRQQLVWGGGVRHLQDDTQTAFPGLVDILPLRRTDKLIDVFAQDTVVLVPQRLDLVVGLKYEDTDYASPQWLPNVRLAFTPTPSRTFWGAVGTGTRVPSRIESDLTFFGRLRLGDDYGPEHVREYEVGWRELHGRDLWYDLVLFYDDYSDLRTGEAGGKLANLMYGHSEGAEAAIRWQARERLRIDLAYTYLTMDLGLAPGSTAFAGQVTQNEGLAPRNQASVRAALDLSSATRLDATLRHVGRLDGLGIGAYTELDLTAGFHFRPDLELIVEGLNLLHDHHLEQGFATSATGLATQVQRSVAARLTWTK